MKNLFIAFFCLLSFNAFSHSTGHENQVLRHWHIQKENTYIDGSFSMFKNGSVYIEDAHHKLRSFPINHLSKNDQSFALHKAQHIESINHTTTYQNSLSHTSFAFYWKFGLFALFLGLLSVLLLRFFNKKKMSYLAPVLFAGILFTLFSFSWKMRSTTDPLFVHSAFAPFLPNVATSYDSNYFYVESKGIPDHTMMVGISNTGWQQQVPIPQCYIGSNAWSIPLNPTIAATPIAIDAVHFTRGAIGIAANGVPIFNYRTNTGIDAKADGQLDTYGGHCGRADDYHYHTAPIHLYTLAQTTTNLPCAFAFDGFAVYGSVEPDGSPMLALDANHGHYGTGGVYHYHGTNTAPYMIQNFVGQVTEDASNQLIPQASAQPVRTENWTPLSGALITSCTPKATNDGYDLSYSLNSTTGYEVNYSWSGTTYTFDYVTPAGTTSTNYNGFTQCIVPNTTTATQDVVKETVISLYPNPSSNTVKVRLGNSSLENQVEHISIYNSVGSLIQTSDKFTPEIDIKNLPAGIYIITLSFSDSRVSKRLIVK